MVLKWTLLSGIRKYKINWRFKVIYWVIEINLGLLFSLYGLVLLGYGSYLNNMSVWFKYKFGNIWIDWYFKWWWIDLYFIRYGITAIDIWAKSYNFWCLKLCIMTLFDFAPSPWLNYVLNVHMFLYMSF